MIYLENPHFSETSGLTERHGHREADWEDQIKKGVEDLLVCIQPKYLLHKRFSYSNIAGNWGI